MGPGRASFSGPALDVFSADSGNGYFALLDTELMSRMTDPEYRRARVLFDSRITLGSWFDTDIAYLTESQIHHFADKNGAFHYAIGLPTAALPTSGKATYNAIGGIVSTSLTLFVPANPYLGGKEFGNLFFSTGQLAVEWGSQTPKLGFGFTIGSRFADQSAVLLLKIATTGGIEDLENSEVSLRSGSATFHGANIGATVLHNPYVDQGADLSHVMASGARTFEVEGFFSGENAERGSLAFWDEDAGPGFSGVAAFSLSTTDVTTGSGGGGGGTGGFTAPLANTAGPLQMASAGPDGSMPSSEDVADITQNATTGLLTRYEYIGEGFVIGSAQGADLGGDALITWGRWVNGTPGRERSYDPSIVDPGDTIGAEQGRHYVLGQPSASLPATGTATYNLLGATSPTFADGASAAGTVTSATLAVAWGGRDSSAVALDMALTMPGDGSYRVTTQAGSEMITSAAKFLDFATPVSVTAGTGRACNGGSACQATINGFFAGDNGARAGLAYRITSGGGPVTGNDILGAAAFIKQ